MPEALHKALTPGQWPTFVFILTRVGGLMMTAPLWSMNGIPRLARMAIGVVLAVMLLPTAPLASVPDRFLLLPFGLAMELLVGLVIGLTAAVIVHGVAMAGEVLAMQMGLSLGNAVSPMSDVLVPGVGQLKSFLALMIYVSLDGHLVLLRGLADSLQVIPPGMKIVIQGGPELAIGLLGSVYHAAIRTAAPAMVALLLVNLAVAITSRAVPQIQAILVLFPVNIGIGLIMIGASITIIGTTFSGWMTSLPERVAFVLQGFRAAPWGF